MRHLRHDVPGERHGPRPHAAAILHRGPDDGGIHVSADGTVGLGSRRLSIIDLSPAGHMPMVSDDGRSGVVLQRRDLQLPRAARGAQSARAHASAPRPTPRSSSTATRSGDARCFARLNGIFAFALWDERRQRLLLARDRFGVKPLYYHLVEAGRLLFASEVKALIAGGYRFAADRPGGASTST